MASTTEVGIKLTLQGEQQVKSALSGVESEMARLSGSIAKIGHYGSAFLLLTQGINPTIGAFVSAADAVTTLNNQLKLATGSTQAAGKAYAALFDIAQRSRVSFTELGGTFASISRAGQELGLSQQRLLGVTEAIGNAMTISGGSAQSMQAALVQLSQGLASGTLRGEELNSVMEQSPRLAKALADGMNVPIGKLRELGAAGQISAEQVIRALENQAAVLKGEVAGAALTVGQAMTQLQNATTVAIGEMDKATGTSETIAKALSALATTVGEVGKAFKDNEVAIKTGMGVLAGAGVGAGALSVAANIGKITAAVRVLGLALSANPYVLAVMGIGAAVGGFSAYASARQNSLEGMRATLKELQSLDSKGSTGMYGTRVSDEVIASRRAEIKRLQLAIAELDSTNLDTRAEDARFAAHVQSAKAAAKDAEAMDGLRTRLSGFKGDYKQYAADLKFIQDQRAKGNLTDAEANKLLTELAKKHGDVTKAAKAQTAAQKLATDGLKLYGDLMAATGGLNQDFAEKWDSLSAAAKRYGWNTEQLTAAQASLLAQQPAMVEAAKEQAKAAEEAAKGLDKWFEARAKETTDLQQQLDAERAELEGLGKTKNALEALAAARLEVAAAAKEQHAADLQAAAPYANEYQAAYEQAAADALRQADILRERASVARQAGVKKEALEAEKEWRKVSEKIEDQLTDALMRGFESGKGFAETLRDTVVNMFKTMVLRPVVSAIVQPVAGSVTNAMGMGGSGNLLGTASDAYSLYSNLTGMGSAVSTAGVLSGSTYSTGILSQQSMMLAAQEAGMGTAAMGASSGAMGTLAAAAPYLAAAAAIYAIMGDTWSGDPDAFLVQGSKGTANPYQNKVDTAFGTLGFADGTAAIRKNGTPVNEYGETQDVAGDTQTKTLAVFQQLDAAIAATLNEGEIAKVAENLSGWYRKSWSFEGKMLGDWMGDRYEAVFASLGNPLGDMFAQFDFSAETLPQFVELFTVLDKAGAGAMGFAAALGDSITAGDNTAATALTLAKNLTGVNQTMDALGVTVLDLSMAGAEAAAGLVQNFGGSLDALNAAVSGYYQNFYTEAERTTRTAAQVKDAMADLGLAMPATRDGFRALVEAQDLTTASGRATWSALMQLQGAFASVTEAAVSSAQSLQQAAMTSLQSSFSAFTSLASSSAGYGNTSGLTDYLGLLQNSFDFASGLGAQVDVLGAMADTESAIADARQAGGQAELTAINARKTALQQELANAQGLLTAAQGLRQYVDGLRTGAASPLSDAEKYQYLGARYVMQLSLARAGDVDSMSSVQGTASAYLDVAKAQSATAADYALAFAKVTGELDALGATTETAADQQVNLLKDQIDALERQTATMESLYGVSRATQDLTFSLLGNARQQLMQDLENAANQLIATDSIAVNLDKLPPELASILSSTMAATLSPMLSGFAASIGSQLTASQAAAAAASAAAGSVTIQATKDQIVVDAIKQVAGGSLVEQVGLYDKLLDNVGYTAQQVQNLITTATGAQEAMDMSSLNVAKAINDAYQSVLGRSAEGGGLDYWMNQYTSGSINLADISAVIQQGALASGELKDLLESVPKFAVGTNYVPRDMLAMVHEGEAIVPKAYNPVAMQGGTGNTERLEALVEGLTAEVKRLQAVVREGNHETRRAADAVNGRPEQPMPVENIA